MKKVKYGIIYISILVVLILASGTVSAADITVNPGGSIQTAINQASNNDVVILNDNNGAAYTYTENVVISKDLTLKSDGSVTVQALNTSKPVFTVNSGGSGSTITGLTISGATNSSGVYLDSVNNCAIENNVIENNYYGVHLYESTDNTLSDNEITDSVYGVFVEDDFFSSDGSNNLISNNIWGNSQGIHLNTITANIHFNRITDNEIGLYISGFDYVNMVNGEFINLEDNWWGSNDPTSKNSIVNSECCDIYYDDIENDLLFVNVIENLHSPWLVLDVLANPESLNNVDSFTVTADMTHNTLGDDTSSSGNIPDGLQVNFTDNIGTVTSSAYTMNGKADATFNKESSAPEGLNIYGAVDNQRVLAKINNNTDVIPPIVSASPSGSDYNTTQSVVLTAVDNVDPNPSIYYTLDGTIPTTLSKKYSGPISVESTVTLKFVAADASGNMGVVQTQNYIFEFDNWGVATVNVTSNAWDTFTEHVGGYKNVTETKVFNWYRLAKLVAGPTGDINILRNYLISTGHNDKIWDMDPLPESVVKGLILNNVYNFSPNNMGWYGEETLNQFVDEWGLSPEYFNYIRDSYEDISKRNAMVNTLYDLMWNDVGSSTVKNPPSNDQNELMWYSRIWSAGNTPYKPFPQTLLYVPSSWVSSITYTVPADTPYDPLSISYMVDLDDPTTWVSVAWKKTGMFQDKVDLIVDGNVVISRDVINSAYQSFKGSYSEEVFAQISYFNELFLAPLECNLPLQIIINEYQKENNTNEAPTISQLENYVLNRLKNKYGFTDDEINFIRYDHDCFIDQLNVEMFYPGTDAKCIDVYDPNGTFYPLNFPGNHINRTSYMVYMNGGDLDHVDAGYEGMRSFAIATTKVSTDEVREWLDQKPFYPVGEMKAAYGTFLTALLLEYCHDMVADSAASKFGVSWSRTSTVVFSVCDDATLTYLTGECDAGMGMSVSGNPGDVWAFRYACSSAISPLEQYVLNSVVSGNLNQNISSVTIGLGKRIMDGKPMDMFESNGYLVIKDAEKNDYFLVLDPSTGIVRDILFVPAKVCGVYCFHDDITDRVDLVVKDILSNVLSVQQTWLNMIGSTAITIGSMVTLAEYDVLSLEVLSTGLVGGLIGLTIGLNIVLTIQYPDIGVPANLEALPVIGPFLSIYSLQSIIRGQGEPLTVENLKKYYLNASVGFQELVENNDIKLYNMIRSLVNNNLQTNKDIQDSLDDLSEQMSRDPGIGGDPDERLLNLFRYFVDKCRSGIDKYKTGDIIGGTIDITIGTFGVNIVGPGWALYEINNAL